MQRNLWLTAFTGKDNSSIDVGLILWVASQFFLMIAMGYSLAVHHTPFEPMAYAGASAALAVGHGGAQKLKASTEPGG